MAAAELTGILFDIQGFSVHDGPGCRTLIFFKGCPLSCIWCSNPEGKSSYPEPLFRISSCTRDALCVEACPAGAISIKTGDLVIDRIPCRTCSTFACVDACCTGALQRCGKVMTVEELYSVIQRDRQYWGSRGGITLTGGEPFSQPGFASAILKRCHDGYIHTAAETCGDFPFSSIEPSLPFLDWLFFDLKHMDPVRHKELTGHNNDRILENARRLAKSFQGTMVFRMTVIPGCNNDHDHLRSLASFIRDSGRHEINILPLHHLGREKYILTGRTYYTDSPEIPSAESLQSLMGILENEGITCYLGSDTPF